MAALLPPSSRIGAGEAQGEPRADLPAHGRRAGGGDERHARIVDEDFAERAPADQNLRQARPARRRSAPRRGATMACDASAVSGVFSEGFQTTGSPQTKASAAFQDHTATGKLNAEMTPQTPSGCHVSIMRWSGRSVAMVSAVELARQPDREVADVDHLLRLRRGPRTGSCLSPG